MIKCYTYFHKKILALPILGPINPGGIYIISTESVAGTELFKTKISLKPFVGEPIELTILHPSLKLTDESIDIDGVEKEGMAWAEQKGLYPGALKKTLEKTFVAGLVASCYPMFNEKQVKLMDKWIRALFAIDDWVDTGKLSLELIRKDIKSKLDLLNKVIANSPDFGRKASDPPVVTPLTESMLELFRELKIEIEKNGGSASEFLASLNTYFQSVLSEKKFEQTESKIYEATSIDIRKDSSGAVHAIKGGAALVGINIKNLESKYYDLLGMLNCSALCVEVSNDLVSDTKERIQLKKDKAYERLEQMRDDVAFNLIQIKWQNGEATEHSFSPVFQECVAVHNKNMEAYYVLKQHLKAEMIQNEKSEDEDLSEIKILHEKVELYLQIMEGWLSQSLWALLVPRYNLDVKVCQSSDLRALEAQIKALT